MIVRCSCAFGPLKLHAARPSAGLRSHSSARRKRTLDRARGIARLEELKYVYTGSVHDEEGGTTYCPSCEEALIVRDRHQIRAYRVTESGACTHCGAQAAGRWQRFGKPCGARRIPVRLSAPA